MTQPELLHYRWSFLSILLAFPLAFLLCQLAWHVMLALMVVHVLLGR